MRFSPDLRKPNRTGYNQHYARQPAEAGFGPRGRPVRVSQPLARAQCLCAEQELAAPLRTGRLIEMGARVIKMNAQRTAILEAPMPPRTGSCGISSGRIAARSRSLWNSRIRMTPLSCAGCSLRRTVSSRASLRRVGAGNRCESGSHAGCHHLASPRAGFCEGRKIWR